MRAELVNSRIHSRADDITLLGHLHFENRAHAALLVCRRFLTDDHEQLLVAAHLGLATPKDIKPRPTVEIEDHPSSLTKEKLLGQVLVRVVVRSKDANHQIHQDDGHSASNQVEQENSLGDGSSGAQMVSDSLTNTVSCPSNSYKSKSPITPRRNTCMKAA
eukprot:CAMPEP_0115338420 /NCGR_PEP_ID=MMETSP0270-20121206/90060_1 /TAXON_ID=71861 /ORGANISM="Scrippsiella trochoidea, Strain CCMP3099" /LENGTH=160 /DNA_ID=CAMNT_0002759719 /DNA_START=203 /DNA_END=685 /DNA_ORIENTATION=+